jgi:hypothetical protein
MFQSKVNMVVANEALWDHFITSVTSKGPVYWSSSSPVSEKGKNKLGLVIIEPRKHKWLEGVLNNFALIYGNTSSICLYIFHGTENKEFIENITANWTNVNFVSLDKDNLTIPLYNELLVSPSFYETFRESCEHILVFQTDTFLFKQIPEVYFQWDYVGAIWRYPPICSASYVGNGGLSLRRVSTMIDICKSNQYVPKKHVAEDVFFSIHTKNKPSREEAKDFSTEHMWSDNPVGMHQFYRFHEWDKIKPLILEFVATQTKSQ